LVPEGNPVGTKTKRGRGFRQSGGKTKCSWERPKRHIGPQLGNRKKKPQPEVLPRKGKKAFAKKMWGCKAKGGGEGQYINSGGVLGEDVFSKMTGGVECIKKTQIGRHKSLEGEGKAKYHRYKKRTR